MVQGSSRYTSQDGRYQSKHQDYPMVKRSYKGLYSEGDCSYFGLVLIPHNEIWWIPYNLLKGKKSVCTNIESDSWAEYRGNTDSLKKWH